MGLHYRWNCFTHIRQGPTAIEPPALPKMAWAAEVSDSGRRDHRRGWRRGPPGGARSAEQASGRIDAAWGDRLVMWCTAGERASAGNNTCNAMSPSRRALPFPEGGVGETGEWFRFLTYLGLWRAHGHSPPESLAA
jgi:hypothetical protein